MVGNFSWGAKFITSVVAIDIVKLNFPYANITVIHTEGGPIKDHG